MGTGRMYLVTEELHERDLPNRGVTSRLNSPVLLKTSSRTNGPTAMTRKDHRAVQNRAPLVRPIRFQLLGARRVSRGAPQQQTALGVNISSRGLCLLLEQPPTVGQVVKVWMPTPLPDVDTPTLAQVRWKRHLRAKPKHIYSVGMAFLL